MNQRFRLTFGPMLEFSLLLIQTVLEEVANQAQRHNFQTGVVIRNALFGGSQFRREIRQHLESEHNELS
jgi:hypothetical protein